MEFNQLRYFYEVARSGSFTGASQRLRISQPSISKMVKQLEVTEGIRFMDRGKRGVRLTPLGKKLFERCEKIFGELDSLRGDIRRQFDSCVGELWLGASDNICNYLLPPLLAEYCAEYPLVRTRLFGGVSEELKSQLRDFRVEISLFYTPTRGSEFVSEKLTSVDFVIVASPSLFASRRGAPSTRDLERLRYIGSLSTDYFGQYPALKMLRSIRLNPEIRIETNIQETQKRLAVEGLGYTVVPRHMVRDELERGRLVEVRSRERLGADIYLVRLKNRTLSRAAVLWSDFLRKKFSR